MKIRDLIKQTGVPKQTIHYYLQNGLLPKPRKLGKNVAEYDQRHVEQIGLIKELQENYFLPLSVIKKILKKHKGDPENQALLKIWGQYFRPLDRFLAGRVHGEAAFVKVTGLRPERLRQYEAWGIMTPEIVDGEKVYSYDDQILGKVIDQWRKIGLTAERGFEPDFLKNTLDAFREIVRTGQRYFMETAAGSMRPEEIKEVGSVALEVTALYYYHLYHKLARQGFEDAVKEQEKTMGKREDTQ
jgi:DNA-binding transcriptional MerR regulator